MNNKIKIYLAGAMSNYSKQGRIWRNKIKNIIKKNNYPIDAIDPFDEEPKITKKSFEESYEHVQTLIKSNKLLETKRYMKCIYLHDLEKIKNSNAVIVMMDKKFHSSVGTHIELIESYKNNVPIYFIYDDISELEKVSPWIYFFQHDIIHISYIDNLFKAILIP